MKISIKKVMTLFFKDLTDVFKNSSVMINVLLPMMFVLLFKNLNLSAQGAAYREQFLLNIGTIMNCTIGGLVLASTMIAEEKEKFTLRTLMLSNVSGTEFLLAKLLVGGMITMAENVIVYLLADADMHHLPVFLLGTLLGTLSVSMLSAVIGILARDQMSCSVLQLPVMVLFMIPSFFGGLNSALSWIAKLTPLDAMMKVYDYGVQGRLISGDALFHFGVMAVWIVGGFLLFNVAYRKKGLDN